ncbi:MAG: hypothetical protein ACRCVI_00455 [Mycoplasmoidaceae bacterium]
MNDFQRKIDELDAYGIALTPELKEKSIKALELEDETRKLDVVARDEVEKATRLIKEAKAITEIAETKNIILEKEIIVKDELLNQLQKEEADLQSLIKKIELSKERYSRKIEDVAVAQEESDRAREQALEISEVANNALVHAKQFVIRTQLLKVKSETAKADFESELEELHARKKAEEARIAQETAKRTAELAEMHRTQAEATRERYDELKKRLEQASKYDIDLNMDIESLNKQKEELEIPVPEVAPIDYEAAGIEEHSDHDEPSDETEHDDLNQFSSHEDEEE